MKIVIRSRLPKLQTMNHFGFIGQQPNAGAVVADYGFCKMRVNNGGTVDFLTDDANVEQSVEHLRDYIAAKAQMIMANELHPIFVVMAEGAVNKARTNAMARVARALGLRRDQHLWVI